MRTADIKAKLSKMMAKKGGKFNSKKAELLSRELLKRNND